jgi:hypothetical protein
MEKDCADCGTAESDGDNAEINGKWMDGLYLVTASCNRLLAYHIESGTTSQVVLTEQKGEAGRLEALCHLGLPIPGSSMGTPVAIGPWPEQRRVLDLHTLKEAPAFSGR